MQRKATVHGLIPTAPEAEAVTRGGGRRPFQRRAPLHELRGVRRWHHGPQTAVLRSCGAAKLRGEELMGIRVA